MTAVHAPRPADLSWREVDGAIVLLDERDWQYLQLRGSGALLWPLLVEGATAEQLAAALVAEFGIEAQRAADDVEHFLVDLRDRDLITSAP